MTAYFERRRILRAQLEAVTPTTERYAILVDTDRSSVVVIRFVHHQELLDLILSNDYPEMILYRTQYDKPTDIELEDLTEKFFS